MKRTASWLMLLATLLAWSCTPAASNSSPTAQSKASPAGVTTPLSAKPANPDLILATTTSTQDSGLLDLLIPLFEKQTGYKVKTVVVGTGAGVGFGAGGVGVGG